MLTRDAAQAREIGRETVDFYLNLSNYLNNWKRLGFTDDDIAKPGSDKLIDAVVAHGTPEDIAARLQEHLDAGADHVCIQVLGGQDELIPTLTELAGPLGLDDRRARSRHPLGFVTMRLLVTGGAGFIGANFVHAAVRDHPEVAVTVLDALTYAGSRESLAPVADDVRLVQGDVTDAELVDKLVAESDAVVHFAAETHVDNSLADPEAFLRTNVIGTFTVLEAVRRHGVRLHHVSTDEVYGDLPLGRSRPVHRGDAVQPVEPVLVDQGRGRHAGARVGAVLRRARDDLELLQQLRAVPARGEVHPAPDHQRADGRRPKLYGAGANVRDWIHVDDHNRACGGSSPTASSAGRI